MQQVANPEPIASTSAQSRTGDTRLLYCENILGSEQRVQHGSIVACVDRSSMDSRVVAHANAVAQRLGVNLVLAQVLETASAFEGPQDPLNWGLRRHKCRERFNWLIREHGLEGAPEQVLLEGKAADQLSAWAGDTPVGYLAFATHDESWACPGLGSTAQRLIELAPVSLLLVPPSASHVAEYSRILVPLDGSCRAESVLPTVLALAAAGDSEVLLAHVVPSPQITEIGPLEPEAVMLRDRLVRRNEQVARTYIERVLRHLRSCGLRARSIIVQGDPRERLGRIAAEEHADLIVIASHGQSGRADVAYGSAAGYLATHAIAPMLILRQGDERRSARGARFHSIYRPALAQLGK